MRCLTARLLFKPVQMHLPTHVVPSPLPMSMRKSSPASPAEQVLNTPLSKVTTSAAIQASHPKGNTIHTTDPSGPSWPWLQDQSWLVLSVSTGTWHMLSPSLAMSCSVASAESLWFTSWSPRGRSGLLAPPEISYQPWKLAAAKGGSGLMSQPQHMVGRVWPSFNPAKYAKKENKSV